MIISKNKQAYFNYNITETFQAGIILEGWEVKSIRAGMANIADAFVRVGPKGAVIMNMHIPRWKTQPAGVVVNETRERAILLGKKELKELDVARKGQGINIILLNLHSKGNLIKAGIGIGRGKKKYDKREAIKIKDVKRDLQRQGERW
jgi:SsrA-binding protein